MKLLKKSVAYLFVGGTAVLASSPFLMDFLGKWEGQGQYVVYADKLANGLPTVCKGITKHTSPYPVIVGERWSPEKCREVEEIVVYNTQIELQKCVKHPVPQEMWDMLTSHAHNFGWPKTCNSQSVMYINKGELKKGCELLSRRPGGSPNWSNAGGNFIQGLFNRRKAETTVCLSGLK